MISVTGYATVISGKTVDGDDQYYCNCVQWTCTLVSFEKLAFKNGDQIYDHSQSVVISELTLVRQDWQLDGVSLQQNGVKFAIACSLG